MTTTDAIKVNRAPVLMLWAAMVAERLGFDHNEALTLGRAVAGLTAHSKGVRLGLFEPTPKEVKEQRAKAKHGEEFTVALLGRAIPVVHTPKGIRALDKEKPASPASVDKYLRSKFGSALDDVTEAMMKLAKSMPHDRLARDAFRLYEQFRPEIPAGVQGWGAKGGLDLSRIAALGKRA